MRALGCDVSHWNGNVDFEKMKSGASFVFMKASELLSTDSMFKENWKKAKEAGLLRGAYHYLNWAKSEVEQAKYFAALLKDDPGELPPVVDFEEPGTYYNLTKAQTQGKLWNFVTTLEKELGRVPMIYSGYYFWYTWGSNAPGWEKYPFWLAWYSSESAIKWYSRKDGGTGAPPPWKNWTFWQYTDRMKGQDFGTQSKQVDGNYFNGEIGDLLLFANQKPAPVIVPVCPNCGGELPGWTMP